MVWLGRMLSGYVRCLFCNKAESIFRLGVDAGMSMAAHTQAYQAPTHVSICISAHVSTLMSAHMSTHMSTCTSTRMPMHISTDVHGSTHVHAHICACLCLTPAPSIRSVRTWYQTYYGMPVHLLQSQHPTCLATTARDKHVGKPDPDVFPTALGNGTGGIMASATITTIIYQRLRLRRLATRFRFGIRKL